MSTITVKIAKLNETRTFDTATWPDVTRVYNETYGATQRFNDAHASVQRKNFPAGDAGTMAWLDAVRTRVDAAIKQYVDGTVPTMTVAVESPLATALRAAGVTAAALGALTADQIAAIVSAVAPKPATESAAPEPAPTPEPAPIIPAAEVNARRARAR